MLRASIAKVAALPCDIMIGAHPAVSDLDGKLKRRAEHREGPDPFIDPGACRAFAAQMTQGLESRIAEEQKAAK
jgi:metallo-beta-lactamase class B